MVAAIIKVKPALLVMLRNEVGRGECQTRFAKLLARFEVNLHPVAGVMLALLKSGQSASREEAVEEMKDCRSMKQHWCRSTVMPEYGVPMVTPIEMKQEQFDLIPKGGATRMGRRQAD
uniref:Uncharacterized protein n=1 Tax=Brassica oleracea var. oleracea TaxID=109376 RepID=A0A0D3AT77_BRAOL